MKGINIVFADTKDHTLATRAREALAHICEVVEVQSKPSLLATLARHRVVLVFLAMDDVEAFSDDTLLEIKKTYPEVVVIGMSAQPKVEDAVAAIREGAYNYLARDALTGSAFREMVERALDAHEMATNAAYLAPQLRNEEGFRFSSHSDEMHRIYDLIQKVARVNTPVLLRGESGTGKEVMAKAIHYNSLRKDGRFVAINCSAIPETLIESELFGHEKGAFTGAIQKKMGKFQYADGGTLFLDEVGDISLAMQVKLLRVLQEKRFMPVGSNQEVKVDVRIIAATHQDLEHMMTKGSLRDDFYYRLSVLPIFLPALRDRKEDIESLIQHFVTKFSQIHDKRIVGVEQTALSLLKDYHWPGNIRELRNVIEHAFVLEPGHLITEPSLPDRLRDRAEALLADEVGHRRVAVAQDIPMDFQREKETFEREFIVRALKRYKGRINRTSEGTNIPKKTLLRKIEKYRIKTDEFRE